MIKKFLETVSYDVRVRNKDFAKVICDAAGNGDRVLDAGCGDFLLSPFLGGRINLFGADLTPPTSQNTGRFSVASILNLPFDDNTFAFSGSLDVIEHLSPSLRERAIHELVRISEKGVILGFPFSGPPEDLDRQFFRKLQNKGLPVPEWLVEHLQNRYPELNEVILMATQHYGFLGKKTEVSIHFSESLRFTHMLRGAAAYSRRLYVGLNILLGSTLPLHLGARKECNSYRSIVLVRPI